MISLSCVGNRGAQGMPDVPLAQERRHMRRRPGKRPGPPAVLGRTERQHREERAPRIPRLRWRRHRRARKTRRMVVERQKYDTTKSGLSIPSWPLQKRRAQRTILERSSRESEAPGNSRGEGRQPREGAIAALGGEENRSALGISYVVIIAQYHDRVATAI